jgi:ankyrin repeat protein
VNKPDEEVFSDLSGGYRPLYVAAALGHHEVVRALLLHPKIDVNITNHLKETPLSVATARGHHEVVRLLTLHAEAPRLEQERIEREAAEAARLEQERIEHEAAEAARLEQERIVA